MVNELCVFESEVVLLVSVPSLPARDCTLLSITRNWTLLIQGEQHATADAVELWYLLYLNRFLYVRADAMQLFY